MMEEQGSSDLKFPLTTPSEERLNNGDYVMNWQIETQIDLPSDRLLNINSNLSCERVSVRLQRVANKKCVVTVIRSSESTYAEAIYAFFRGILLLEIATDLVDKIEATPRAYWKMMFFITDREGALDNDKTPLMLAAQKGDVVAVKNLLATNKEIGINVESPLGFTALMYAAAKGHIEVMETLIQHGADIQIPGKECTPVEMGVTGGYDAINLLLQAGADVDARNRYGETALMYAAAWGLIPIVKLLIQRGADSSMKDNKGSTALDWADRNKQIEVLQVLKQNNTSA